jgi:hypothetical protein
MLGEAGLLVVKEVCGSEGHAASDDGEAKDGHGLGWAGPALLSHAMYKTRRGRGHACFCRGETEATELGRSRREV